MSDDGPGVSHAPIKALRKVSRSPYKVTMSVDLDGLDSRSR